MVGPVSAFMSDRYGFEADNCVVVAFTGDNPSSLAGMGLGPRHSPLAISLGSSDTVMAWIDKYPYGEPLFYSGMERR